MGTRRKTLAQWVEDALSDKEKEAECTLMTCVYHRDVGGTKEIDSIKLKGKTHIPEDIAGRFQGKAEVFAQDMGGLQHFEILAFYGDQKEPQATHPFVIAHGELLVGGQNRAAKETPDAQGLTAASMKHAERAYDQLDTVVQTMYMTSLAREKDAHEREKECRNEVNDAYKIVRDLMFESKKMDHEMRMAELKYIRESDLYKGLVQGGPALLNTITGREIIPQSTADTSLINMLLDRADPKMIEIILANVPKEVGAVLAARASDHAARKRAEAEAAKSLPPTSSDPREDAGGGTAEVVSITKRK